MAAGRLIAVLFGALGLFFGGVFVTGATGMLAARDDDGFITTNPHQFQRESNAIITEDLDILSDAPNWVIDVFADPADVRLVGSSPADRSLFIGIGPTADVDLYLAGVAHDEITEMEFDGDEIIDVVYDGHAGTAVPGPPASEAFWAMTAEGTGQQILDWDIESGNWTVVVMNSDGGAGIDAELGIGFRISSLGAILWSALGFGVLSLLGGAYLLYRGIRSAGIRGSQPPQPAPPVAPSTPSVDLRDSIDITSTGSGEEVGEGERARNGGQ